MNWEGSVFRGVGEAATATATSRKAGHDYVIGCDWGRSNDFTVFVVVDVTARTVVALDRSRRVDYSLQCERLKVLRAMAATADHCRAKRHWAASH